MQTSHVTVSLRDENQMNCSYAIVRKGNSAVVIVVRNSDCAIFDWAALQSADCDYLLLKHYPTDSIAYRDFLKLIGKMCTKREDSKYFGPHLDEDNWMIADTSGRDRMIHEGERTDFAPRRAELIAFVLEHAACFR